jgi:hypothetical protein
MYQSIPSRGDYKEPLPPILLKALQDEWYYLIETVTGLQIMFSMASFGIDSQWIKLHPVGDAVGTDIIDGPVSRDVCVLQKQTVDIRVDQIAWVAEGKR